MFIFDNFIFLSSNKTVNKFFSLEEIWTLFFRIIIFCSLIKESWLSRILKFPLFVFLGSISFSIYLIHHTIVIYAGKLLPYVPLSETGRYLLLILFFLPLSCFVSLLFYFGVEKFFNKKLRKYISTDY